VSTCISAIRHLRPLRGGAQSHLLKAPDGGCYVTKFQNNPQHIRVLANEMLANLALALGLPMPRVEVIEVSGWLIEQTEDRAEQVDAHTIWRCAADIPEEWYEGDRDGLDRLVQALHQRRGAIRNLIIEFRRSSRNPFSNWRESPADSAMPLVASDRIA